MHERNITRVQFRKILPILESAKNKTKPRTADLYLVFCGILYLLKTGCHWRLIPKEYPDWNLLYYYFTIWNETGVLDKALKKIIGAVVEVVKRSELHKFVAIPKRWVVERSFSWLKKCRRLWKNR